MIGTEDPIRPVLPSATGFAARQAIAALRQRNFAIAPLLQRIGLSEHDLDDRQRRISAIAQGKLLEYAAEVLGDALLGLHLAQRANPREVGLLFYVASAAEDIGEALALYARYCRIVNEAVRPKLIRSAEGVAVQTKFVDLPRPFAWQNTEFVIAGLIKSLREMASRDFQPRRVTFTLARNVELPEFERFFGCPVEFSASADQMDFSTETLAIPLLTEDRHLLDTLQPICEEAAKERNTGQRTLRASVENEVQKLLPNGKANKQTVARVLGISEKALSRGLVDEGAKWTDPTLKQATRKDSFRAKRTNLLPFTSAAAERRIQRVQDAETTGERVKLNVKSINGKGARRSHVRGSARVACFLLHWWNSSADRANP